VAELSETQDKSVLTNCFYLDPLPHFGNRDWRMSSSGIPGASGIPTRAAAVRRLDVVRGQRPQFVNEERHDQRSLPPPENVYFRCLQYPFDSATEDFFSQSTSLKLFFLPHPKTFSNSGNSRLFCRLF